VAILGQELIIGAGSTPTDDIPDMKGINGDSFLLGGTFDGSSQGSASEIGWKYSGGSLTMERFFLLIDIPVDPAEIAGHEIEVGEFWIPFRYDTWGETFDEDVSFGIYLLIKTADLANATWANRAAGTPWAELGGKLGSDLEAVRLATFTIDSDLFDIIAALDGGNPAHVHREKVTLTAAYRYAAERAKTSVQLMLRPDWDRPATNISKAIGIQDSRSSAAYPHAYSRIVSLPPLAPFGVTDGEIDYTKYLDPTLDGREARVQTGSPAPGGTGPSRMMGWANTTGNAFPHAAIVRALALADTPTRPGGVCKLKHVHAFDTTGGNGVSDGSIRIAPVTGFEATRYEIYWTPQYGTEDLTPLETVGAAVYGLYANDETWEVDGTPAFKIDAEWWKDTLDAGEEITVTILGDHRPAGYTIAAAERHEMTNHEGLFDSGTTESRTTPEEAHWRNCYRATYQQLTAASFTDTYEAATRRFLPVGDVNDFEVDESITVFGTIADEETVAYYTVHALIPSSDGDAAKRDSIVLPANDGIAWGTDAVVLSGVYLGSRVGGTDVQQLSARERRFLLNPADVGAAYVDLEESLETASGIVRLVSPAGDFEFRNYSQSGARLNFTGGQTLEYEYPDGSFVVVKEATSWCPTFYRLRPEEGATQAEQLAQTRGVRIGIK
jgi:hypothetical protein